jgi:hypothetical protein
MSKILTNNTASNILITDTGTNILANSSYTIPPTDYWLWAASSDIIVAIGNGSITVNDGSFNLTINHGVALIQHMFPSEVTVNNTQPIPVIVDDTDPVEVTGNLTVTLKHSDIQRNAEFSINSKVETDISGVSYTVTAGKTFYITQFACASDSPSPVAIRLRVYNGATLINTVKLNLSSNGAWGGHSWPQGVLFAQAGYTVKATFDPQAAKGAGWAMFAGFEV